MGTGTLDSVPPAGSIGRMVTPRRTTPGGGTALALSAFLLTGPLLAAGPAHVGDRELAPRIVGFAPAVGAVSTRVAWLRLRDTRPGTRSDSYEGYDLVLEVVVATLATPADVLEVWPLGEVVAVGDGESVSRSDDERHARRQAAVVNRRLKAGGFVEAGRPLGRTVTAEREAIEYRGGAGGRQGECWMRPRLEGVGEPPLVLMKMPCPLATPEVTAVDTVLTPGGDLLVLWAPFDWSGSSALTPLPWPEGAANGPRTSPTALPRPAEGRRGAARVRRLAPHLVGWSADGQQLAYVTAIHWCGQAAELALVIHDVRADTPAGLISLGWFPHRKDDLVGWLSSPTSTSPLDPTFTRSRRHDADSWLRDAGFGPARALAGPLVCAWEGDNVEGDATRFGEEYRAVSFVRVSSPVRSPDDRLAALLVDVDGWQERDHEDDLVRSFALRALGNPRPVVDLKSGLRPPAHPD